MSVRPPIQSANHVINIIWHILWPCENSLLSKNYLWHKSFIKLETHPPTFHVITARITAPMQEHNLPVSSKREQEHFM